MFEQGLNLANTLHLHADGGSWLGWGGDQMLICDQAPLGHKAAVCFLGLTLLPSRCNLWTPCSPCTSSVFSLCPLTANLGASFPTSNMGLHQRPRAGDPQSRQSPWRCLLSRAVLLQHPDRTIHFCKHTPIFMDSMIQGMEAKVMELSGFSW